MSEEIPITVNGQRLTVPAGTTVAAAVARAGVAFLRRSVSGEPRSPFCGTGICYECRVTINGEPHERSCLVQCQTGMDVRTDA